MKFCSVVKYVFASWRCHLRTWLGVAIFGDGTKKLLQVEVSCHVKIVEFRYFSRCTVSTFYSGSGALAQFGILRCYVARRYVVVTLLNAYVCARVHSLITSFPYFTHNRVYDYVFVSLILLLQFPVHLFSFRILIMSHNAINANVRPEEASTKVKEAWQFADDNLFSETLVTDIDINCESPR